MPSLVLFGRDGPMARHYDVPRTWTPRLMDMQAEAIPGGHFFADSAPHPTAAALMRFLAAQPR